MGKNYQKEKGEWGKMNAIGIVAEYDPFHKGHQYHIAATRVALGEDLPVVCAMSGNWTQRGSAALVDKWTRARLALQGGADLVLELPTPWAAASAESFAHGAVELLGKTGVVDILSFGSESGDLTELRRAADALNTLGYPDRLRQGLEKGLSYAAARAEAAGCPCLDTPNNNLAVEYLRAIDTMGLTITPVTVQRVGDGHNTAVSGSGYASASAIRSLLRAGEESAFQWLPEGSREALGEEFASLNRVFPAILAKLRTMTPEELSQIPDCREGLENRILEAAGKARTLDELYDLAKSKRYAHARIRRVVLRAFLGLEKIPKEIPYLRVLGMTGRGRELLKEMKRQELPIITKTAQWKDHPLLQAEARYTDLYALCFEKPRPSGLEWTTSPVIL